MPEIYVDVQINDKIQPIDRGDVYEDPLDEWLQDNNYGEVMGGGTFLDESGEIGGCELEITLSDQKFIPELIKKLESYGAPKGSIIKFNDENIEFGKLEGLGLYINGTELPSEVYANCDINFVLSEIERLTKITPAVNRFWEGSAETALYFYGPSFEKMKKEISHLIETYPLCQKSRVIQIA